MMKYVKSYNKGPYILQNEIEANIEQDYGKIFKLLLENESMISLIALKGYVHDEKRVLLLLLAKFQIYVTFTRNVLNNISSFF